MKNYLKVLALVAFVFVVTGAQAQTTGLPVSKAVNLISNKSLNEFKATEVQSLGTPAFVNTKRQAAPVAEVTTGNVPSKGYPTWTISKGVQRVGRK
ncbi:MAG: hypothetical protein KF775_05700 [Cyclobacteriaceae bacterium]|nr:hypothetical protein [Cyclobacteriaceae bacterium]